MAKSMSAQCGMIPYPSPVHFSVQNEPSLLKQRTRHSITAIATENGESVGCFRLPGPSSVLHRFVLPVLRTINTK